MNMDQKWLRHIISQQHEASYRWACHCCHGDPELAKDVLQMVYLKLLEGKAKYDQKSQVKTWLFAIIRFTAIDELKKQGRHEFVDLGEIKNRPQDHALGQDSYSQLLNQLSEKQREILLLVFYHDMTIETAAIVMGCSIGTARTHYQRGKKRLKEMITHEKVK